MSDNDTFDFDKWERENIDKTGIVIRKTREIDTLRERIKELESALVKIRGWREIGNAHDARDFLNRIEEIAEAALKETVE